MEDKAKEELEELIKEGEKLSSDIKYSSGGDFITPYYYFTDGSSYIEWLEACYYWVSINNESFRQKIQTHYNVLKSKRMNKK